MPGATTGGGREPWQQVGERKESQRAKMNFIPQGLQFPVLYLRRGGVSRKSGEMNINGWGWRRDSDVYTVSWLLYVFLESASQVSEVVQRLLVGKCWGLCTCRNLTATGYLRSLPLFLLIAPPLSSSFGAPPTLVVSCSRADCQSRQKQMEILNL